jgi:hypothetical protein
MMTRPLRILRIILAIVIGLLLGNWLAVRAHAHDWYPIECCHSVDCAPVDRVEVVAGAIFYAGQKIDPTQVPTSVMIVTTSRGTGIVPADLPRRESKDNRMHACLRKVWALGGEHSEVRCIFMPPAM